MTNKTTTHPASTIREDILALVHPRLVNAKMFAKDMETMPHRKFFSEMAIMYYCRSDYPEHDGILHIGAWINVVSNITEEELYEAAVRNSAGKWTCIDFADFGLSLGERKEMVLLTYKDFEPFGAVAILHDEALRQMSSILGGDFYAIPSSVHEFICIRADTGADPAELKKMTGAVNRFGVNDFISEYEILGEAPLFYDAKEGILKEVEKC